MWIELTKQNGKMIVINKAQICAVAPDLDQGGTMIAMSDGKRCHVQEDVTYVVNNGSPVIR